MIHNLNWEGAPRFEFELLSRLTAAGSIEAEVISPCDGPMRLAYEQKGIKLRVVPELADMATVPKSYEEGTRYLSGLIRHGRYEVVHANTLESFWGIDAARMAGTPSVWSIHESEPWQTYFDDLPREIAATALACLSYPYRVVFSAKSSADRFSALNSIDNFGLIRFPLDNNRFNSELARIDRRDGPRRAGFEADDFCVLLLGTVCERKGQHDLLRAFESLPEGIAARTTCLVVGSRDQSRLQPQARGNGPVATRGSSPPIPRDTRDGRDSGILACGRRVLLHVTRRKLSARDPRSHGRRVTRGHDASLRNRRTGATLDQRLDL